MALWATHWLPEDNSTPTSSEEEAHHAEQSGELVLVGDRGADLQTSWWPGQSLVEVLQWHIFGTWYSTGDISTSIDKIAAEIQKLQATVRLVNVKMQQDVGGWYRSPSELVVASETGSTMQPTVLRRVPGVAKELEDQLNKCEHKVSEAGLRMKQLVDKNRLKAQGLKKVLQEAGVCDVNSMSPDDITRELRKLKLKLRQERQCAEEEAAQALLPTDVSSLCSLLEEAGTASYKLDQKLSRVANQLQQHETSALQAVEASNILKHDVEKLEEELSNMQAELRPRDYKLKEDALKRLRGKERCVSEACSELATDVQLRRQRLSNIQSSMVQSDEVKSVAQSALACCKLSALLLSQLIADAETEAQKVKTSLSAAEAHEQHMASGSSDSDIEDVDDGEKYGEARDEVDALRTKLDDLVKPLASWKDRRDEAVKLECMLREVGLLDANEVEQAAQRAQSIFCRSTANTVPSA